MLHVTKILQNFWLIIVNVMSKRSLTFWHARTRVCICWFVCFLFVLFLFLVFLVFFFFFFLFLFSCQVWNLRPDTFLTLQLSLLHKEYFCEITFFRYYISTWKISLNINSGTNCFIPEREIFLWNKLLFLSLFKCLFDIFKNPLRERGRERGKAQIAGVEEKIFRLMFQNCHLKI